MQAQLDREGWKRANCFGALLRAKTAAEGELKTMSALSVSRREGRHGNTVQDVARLANELPTRHGTRRCQEDTATVRNRERRRSSR